MMQQFEKLFIEYNDLLLSQTYSFEKVLQMQSLFSELISESDKLFSKINNKEKWLKSEVFALINDSIIIDLPFTEDFNFYYIKHYWRFELISEYLKRLNKKFDIGSEINSVFKYFLTKGEAYKIMRYLTYVIPYVSNYHSQKKIIKDILHEYFSEEDYEDKDMLLEIKYIIREHFQEKDLSLIKKQFPSMDV